MFVFSWLIDLFIAYSLMAFRLTPYGYDYSLAGKGSGFVGGVQSSFWFIFTGGVGMGVIVAIGVIDAIGFIDFF